MSTHICGAVGAPADALRVLVSLAYCCHGATLSPADCTCWEPEYDLEQEPPNEGLAAVTRSAMCSDCAYRPNSPERSGDPNYEHSDVDGLAELAGGMFWCHQGMRKPLRWRHPAGITVEATGDYYAPPLRVVGGEVVPFRADGTPGERCAGWDAHRRRDLAPLLDYVAEAGDELATLEGDRASR